MGEENKVKERSFGNLTVGDTMASGELLATHRLYEANVDEWSFLLAAYEGTRSLIELGYIQQHERESEQNWQRRQEEAYGFGYTKSVIDLFNFYLFKKEVKRSIPDGLKNDPAWIMFMADCNLEGDTLETFLTDADREASICGHVGILVDKPSREVENRQQENDAGIYPYVSLYYPDAILDWKFEKDENDRLHLSYLKLRDDPEGDTAKSARHEYRMWFKDHFEVWETPEVRESENEGEGQARLINVGENPIGEIPFVWLYNMRGRKKPIGISDIHEVSRIDVSILRNLSGGEEMIYYAAFPMMLKPGKQGAGPTGDGAVPPATDDETGVTAVLEFDPDHPESKPEWLNSAVAEPMNAILAWIDRKVAEIYRAVNAGGMAGMEISTVAKSGTALKAEFQLLNAHLVRKAINLEKAEDRIDHYWVKWQGLEKYEAEIENTRERTYDVEDLHSDLENAITAISIVHSDTFKKKMEKRVVRQSIPSIEEEELKEIDAEIDEYEPPALPAFNPGISDEGEEDEEEGEGGGEGAGDEE